MIESSKENINERPLTSDIVSINGRWGQIVGSSNNTKFEVKWLDNQSIESFNVKGYALEKLNSTVAKMEAEFNEKELSNIYFNPSDENLELKASTRIFGRYTVKFEKGNS